MVGPASLDLLTSFTVPVPFVDHPLRLLASGSHWLLPQVYVLKRPHVDEFLQRMGELFECVLFTASLAKVSPCQGPGSAMPHPHHPPTSNQQPGAALARTPSEVTSLPPQYADPVADLLDKWGAFRARLFRESCVFHRGNYVKDLSRLGRDLRRVLILDNSPASYVFHPDNAVSARTCAVASPAPTWGGSGAGNVLLPVSAHISRFACVWRALTPGVPV